MRRSGFVSTAVFVMMAFPKAFAGTPIPIDSPTVITRPGEYFLTEDIGCGYGGPIPIVISASDVTLDLQGHTVTCDTGLHSVLVEASAANVTIENGTIELCCPSSAALGSYGRNIHLRNLLVGDDYLPVEIVNSDIFTIENCTIFANAMGLMIYRTKPGFDTGTVIGNKFIGNQYAFAGYIEVSGALVSGNTFNGGSGRDGLTIDSVAGQPGNLIELNTFNRYGPALKVYGDGNLVRQNIISNGGASESAIYVIGTGNLVADNEITFSGTGITTDGAANRIVNNIVSDGANTYSSFAGGLLIKGEANEIIGNGVFRNRGAGVYLLGDEDSVVGNDIENNTDCAIVALKGSVNTIDDNILHENGHDTVCLLDPKTR